MGRTSSAIKEGKDELRTFGKAKNEDDDGVMI